MSEPPYHSHAAMTSDITVSSHSQLDDKDVAAWDALARVHAPDLPFQQSSVVCAMARMSAPTSEAIFVLVRMGTPNRLVGGLALGITNEHRGPFRRRKAHGLSPGRSDLTQLLVNPEHRAVVESAVSRHLDSLRAAGTLFDVLGVQLSATLMGGLGSAWRAGSARPIREATLIGATSWQDVIGSGHQRREVQRAARALARDHNPTLRWADSPGEATELIDAFRELHSTEQLARGRPAAFDSPAARDGLRDLFGGGVATGTADVAVLTSDSGQVIAGYTLLHAGELTLAYRTTFDRSFARYAPGVQLLASAIDRAIGRGSARFGFSWGDEPYKAHWSEVTGHVVRLHGSPPGRRHIGFRVLERLGCGRARA